MVKIKNKKAVRYICKNLKGLSIILTLINGKLISSCKIMVIFKILILKSCQKINSR